ncbi:hypothetical protein V3C99_001412 [Haemonchus contortus]
MERCEMKIVGYVICCATSASIRELDFTARRWPIRYAQFCHRNWNLLWFILWAHKPKLMMMTMTVTLMMTMMTATRGCSLLEEPATKWSVLLNRTGSRRKFHRKNGMGMLFGISERSLCKWIPAKNIRIFSETRNGASSAVNDWVSYVPKFFPDEVSGFLQLFGLNL